MCMKNQSATDKPTKAQEELFFIANCSCYCYTKYHKYVEITKFE